eukprot:jgi/Botrbrau1/4076/Bobra.152_3s0030.2
MVPELLPVLVGIQFLQNAALFLILARSFGLVGFPRREWWVLPRSTHWWDTIVCKQWEEEFDIERRDVAYIRAFRVDKATFHLISNIVELHVKKCDTRWRQAIDVRRRVGSQISTIDADNEDCDDFSGDFSDPYDEENVNSLTPLDGSRTAPSTHGKTGSRGDPPVQTEEQEGTATSPFKKRAARSRKGGHACSLETPKPVDKHITGKRIAREKKSAPGLDDAVTKIAAASQAVGGFLESWPTTYQKSQQLAAEAQKPTPEDKALELRAEFAKRKLQGEPVGMTLEELEDYINKFILPQSSKAPNSIDGTRDEVVLLDDSPPRAKKVAAARGKPTGKSAYPQEINHPQPLGPTPAAPQSNCPNLNSAPVNQLPLGKTNTYFTYSMHMVTFLKHNYGQWDVQEYPPF